MRTPSVYNFAFRMFGLMTCQFVIVRDSKHISHIPKNQYIAMIWNRKTNKYGSTIRVNNISSNAFYSVNDIFKFSKLMRLILFWGLNSQPICNLIISPVFTLMMKSDDRFGFNHYYYVTSNYRVNPLNGTIDDVIWDGWKGLDLGAG